MNIYKLLLDEKKRKRLAKLIVHDCVRNTYLEDLHAGKSPYSKYKDNRDVVVISKNVPKKWKDFEKIKWKDLSRLNDNEMKILMKEVVDRTYTYLTDLVTNNSFLSLIDEALGRQDIIPYWDEPKYTKINLKDDY